MNETMFFSNPPLLVSRSAVPDILYLAGLILRNEGSDFVRIDVISIRQPFLHRSLLGVRMAGMIGTD